MLHVTELRKPNLKEYKTLLKLMYKVALLNFMKASIRIAASRDPSYPVDKNSALLSLEH